MPAASPSGATGITAAVLAGLGALTNIFGGIAGLIGLLILSNDSTFDALELSGGAKALLALVLVLNLVSGLLLGAGTVMLLLRKMIGRWLVVAGCGVTILSSLIGVGISSAAASQVPYGGGGVSSLLSLIFPVLTLVLALLPSTTAWIRAKENPVAPQPYPPYQGWA